MISIFLDSNAGAPIHPFVVEALSAFLQEQSSYSERGVGNPSSLHEYGRRASAMIAQTQEAILHTLRADPKEWRVVFTSGGTEANQLAILGTLGRALDGRTKGQGAPIWCVSPLEHHCILDLVEPLRKRGVEVRVLPVTSEGEASFPPEMIDGAALISTMAVNNETGIVQNYSSITSHIQCTRTPFPKTSALHSDFVAGWGKVEFDLSQAGAPDFVALAGHKLGGLSGIGALVYRKRFEIDPVLRGNQQAGLRGGTENLFGIRSLLALTEAWERIRGETESLRALRDEFESGLKARFPRIEITGDAGARAPHISHFVFKGISKALPLVAQLDLRGFAVSSGSACASAIPEPSHVLLALGMSKTDALNALRVSLHPGSTREDLTGLLAALESILKRYETA